jgi:hypothetical protein
MARRYAGELAGASPELISSALIFAARSRALSLRGRFITIVWQAGSGRISS